MIFDDPTPLIAIISRNADETVTVCIVIIFILIWVLF